MLYYIEVTDKEGFISPLCHSNLYPINLEVEVLNLKGGSFTCAQLSKEEGEISIQFMKEKYPSYSFILKEGICPDRDS